MYKLISIYLSILIILIILIYFFIMSNHKVNNYITNKINKLPFYSIMEFKNKYSNLQTSYKDSKILCSTLPIYIFYHIGINENYENLINDQLNEIFY